MRLRLVSGIAGLGSAVAAPRQRALLNCLRRPARNLLETSENKKLSAPETAARVRGLELTALR